MNDELRNGLRWVLLTTEEDWRVELEQVFEQCSVDIDDLGEVETLLTATMSAAAPLYRARMEAMLVVVRQKMATGGGGVEDLAERYAQLDDELAALERQIQEKRGELEKVSKQLLRRIEEPVELGRYRFERIEGSQKLVVEFPETVPEELCTPGPDMTKLERAWKIRGDAPIGTRVVVVDPSLDVFRIA